MEIESTIKVAAGIVSAFAASNRVSPSDIPKLLSDTHAAVVTIAEGKSPLGAPDQPSTKTPQEIKKSITHDKLISFEDGKPYKTLRRHLTLRGLTPEQYRVKHGLPPDYPMTSKAYSQSRSELAKSLGLGQRNRPASA